MMAYELLCCNRFKLNAFVCYGCMAKLWADNVQWSAILRQGMKAYCSRVDLWQTPAAAKIVYIPLLIRFTFIQNFHHNIAVLAIILGLGPTIIFCLNGGGKVWTGLTIRGRDYTQTVLKTKSVTSNQYWNYSNAKRLYCSFGTHNYSVHYLNDYEKQNICKSCFVVLRYLRRQNLLWRVSRRWLRKLSGIFRVQSYKFTT